MVAVAVIGYCGVVVLVFVTIFGRVAFVIVVEVLYLSVCWVVVLLVFVEL